MDVDSASTCRCGPVKLEVSAIGNEMAGSDDGSGSGREEVARFAPHVVDVTDREEASSLVAMFWNSLLELCNI